MIYSQHNLTIIIFAIQASLSNQNSTPLNLDSNDSGISVQNCGMSYLLALNDLRICQFSKEV